MNHWFMIAIIIGSVFQCGAYRADFIVCCPDEPVKKSHHIIRNSKIFQKLTAGDSNYYDTWYCSSNNFLPARSAHSLINNHRACATWKVENYWNAVLEVFGRPYLLDQIVNLPPEYKCFCTDDKYQYYIHDSERYIIMEQWPLYDYSEFWAFIQNYPDYEQCMRAIDDIVQHDYALRQKLSSQAIQRIHTESQRIKKKEQLQNEMRHRFVVQETCAAQSFQLYQQISESHELLMIHKNYGFGDTDYIEKRTALIDDMQKRGALYETRSYDIPLHVQECLRKHGHDAAAYATLYGNQIQQLVHQDCISLIEKVTEVHHSSFVSSHKEALIDCIDAARQYNNAGLTYKAIHITDFCRALLEYGQAVLRGAAQGVVGAVQDCLEHPIQTALCVAAGEYVVAYQLCKVIFNVAEIGITSLYNGEKGLQKWNDFIEPISSIIDSLYNKEISLRDAVKGATQFAVHWKAQSKLLGGLGKFYKATKAKALELRAKNPLSSPEQYLATPEGITFKASLVAENNKLPSHCKKVSNSYGNRTYAN